MATFKEVLVTNGGRSILDKLTPEEWELLDTSIADFSDEYADIVMNAQDWSDSMRVLFIMDNGYYTARDFEEEFEGQLVADILDKNLLIGTNRFIKFDVVTFNKNTDRAFVEVVKTELMSDDEKEFTNFYLETDII